MKNGERWTRLRRKLIVDRYSGEPTFGSWDDPDEHPLFPCAFAPGTSNEFPTVEREQLRDLATLYVPYQADVDDEDRVRGPDGRVWSVEGSRADWRNPHTGTKAGSDVQIKRWKG